MRYRFVTIMLFAFCAIILFAGCNQQSAGNFEEKEPEKISETETAQVTNVTENPTTISVGEIYSQYYNTKDTGYQAIIEKFEGHELFDTLITALQPIGDADRLIAPLSTITNDIEEFEMAGMELGLQNLSEFLEDNRFQIQYIADNGICVKIDGEYDSLSNSIKCTCQTGDFSLSMQITGYQDGFIAQYFSMLQDNTTSTVKVFADGEDIIFGRLDNEDEPPSLYQNPPADFSFFDDCTTIVKIIDGKGYCQIDGQEISF